MFYLHFWGNDTLKVWSNLKISAKKTSKYKSEGNFSHILKTPDNLWDLSLIRAILERQHIQKVVLTNNYRKASNSWDEHLESLVSIQHLCSIRNTFHSEVDKTTSSKQRPSF